MDGKLPDNTCATFFDDPELLRRHEVQTTNAVAGEVLFRKPVDEHGRDGDTYTFAYACDQIDHTRAEPNALSK